MAGVWSRWCSVALVASSAVAGATGCGEGFSVTGGTGGTGATGGTGVTTTTGGGGSGAASTSSSGGTTTGSGECQSGTSESCYSGPVGTESLGACKPGVRTCTNGTWGACEGEVVPLSQEICDGVKDDDCNGSVDNGCDCSQGQMATCYEGPAETKNEGACKNGVQACLASGVFGPCTGQVLPGAEACDGADNDCDGTVDNNIPGVGVSCDTDAKGVCKPGTKHCTDNIISCQSLLQPTTEVCDGLDNNCDGNVDNGIQQTACMTEGAVTMCPGKTACAPGGIPLCIPTAVFVETFSSPDSLNNWQLDDEWAIGVTAVGPAPAVGKPDPAQDHTPTNDNRVAGVVLGGNGATQPNEAQYLTSKSIDTSQANGPLYLSFWRWLNANVPSSNIDTVEVWNGSLWVFLWGNGVDAVNASTQDSEWTFQKFDVTSHKNGAFKIRFGHVVGMGASQVSSWNIDDIVLGACAPN